MRKTKRFAAAVAALAMAVSMVAASSTMTAFAEDPTYKITINNPSTDEGKHTYEYAQIFTGTVNGQGEISNASFGSGITAENLYSAMSGFSETAGYSSLKATSTADDFIAFMSKITDGEALARAIKKVATTTKLTSSTTVPAGYYLIVDAASSPRYNDDSALDTAPQNSGAKTAFILKVVKNEAVTVTAKSAAPTVDKQVVDDFDGTVGEGFDNNGYGETADHAIGEEFNFKLTATIPDNSNIDKYTKYSLRFVDTIDSGIDYVAIDSVTINGTEIKSMCVTDFNAEGKKNGTGYFYIDDIKLGNENADIKGAVVEVIYKAKLNSSAKVAGDTPEDIAADINKNKVMLEYSNNPNYKGTGTLGSDTTDGNGEKNEQGHTPEDYVGVYTYKILNTKVDKATQKEMAGAEFKLTEIANQNAEGLTFVYDSTKKAYVPATGVGASATIVSQGDGTFNIIGLDAGTYYLYETKAPADYNQLANPIEVTITANHKEKANTDNEYVLEPNQGYGAVNKVENVKGAVLPETGGIGTTMFYVGGGALAAVAGTVLIAKKRAKKED